MKVVELYQKARHAVMIDGMSRRRAATYFGIDRKTVEKMLVFPEPPPQGRCGRSFSRKLAEFTAIIDWILAEDRTVHAKQRHTAVRIFERLRDEHGCTGGITIVRDYVAGAKLRSRKSKSSRATVLAVTLWRLAVRCRTPSRSLIGGI